MRQFRSLFSPHYFLFIILLVIHLVLLLNLRFEAWPEMLVYPYLLQRGFSLYQDIINAYPPLFHWILSGYFSLAGISVRSLTWLTWGMILAIDMLIFWIAKKKYGPNAALVALAFFIVWQPLLDGNGLWFDLALTPLLLLAFYSQSPIWLTLAFFIKQSVIWLFLLFIKQWKKLVIAFTCLFLIISIPFIVSASFSDYWFWSWVVPFRYYPVMPGHKDLASLRLWLIAVSPFIPMLLFLFTRRRIKTFFPPWSPQLPIFWAALSFSLILPRFGLFHLQPALAFAALSIGQLFHQVSFPKIFKHNMIKLLAIGYGLLAIFMWQRHIKLFWHQPTRFFEPDIVAAAQQLQQNTSTTDTVLFLNSPDQLMVLAQRLPPKPWVDTFPWFLELPQFQDRLISAYQSQNLTKVVFIPYGTEGRFTPGSYRPEKLDQFVSTTFSHYVSLGANLYLYSR